MVEYCFGCKEKHNDYNWRYGPVEVSEGKKEDKYLCSKWFHPTSRDSSPDRIKEDRQKYWNDIVQPYRGGEISREYIEAYPARARKMFTEAQIRKSKHVWKDLPGWSNRAKTGKGKVKNGRRR